MRTRADSLAPRPGRPVRGRALRALEGSRGPAARAHTSRRLQLGQRRRRGPHAGRHLHRQRPLGGRSAGRRAGRPARLL